MSELYAVLVSQGSADTSRPEQFLIYAALRWSSAARFPAADRQSTAARGARAANGNIRSRAQRFWKIF